MATYCTTSDVDQWIANLPIASGLSRSDFITHAVADIHLAAAGLYKIPITIGSGVASTVSGATTEILKMVNSKRAAGYLLLSTTVAQENQTIHDLADRYLEETQKVLTDLREQKLVFVGADVDDTKSDDMVRPGILAHSAPDGRKTALDSRSYFGRGIHEIGVAGKRVDFDKAESTVDTDTETTA